MPVGLKLNQPINYFFRLVSFMLFKANYVTLIIKFIASVGLWYFWVLMFELWYLRNTWQITTHCSNTVSYLPKAWKKRINSDADGSSQINLQPCTKQEIYFFNKWIRKWKGKLLKNVQFCFLLHVYISLHICICITFKNTENTCVSDHPNWSYCWAWVSIFILGNESESM